MDDAELMQRWQSGDRSAFEVLIQRWQQPIARFLFRLTGEAELTQDLAQEVFLRVYQAQQSYHENGTFAAWLYRIALNVARDSARRQKPTVPLSLYPEPIREEDPDQLELRTLVAQIISEMPEELRLVIHLRLDERRNFEEIARQTGTAASTWKSRFSRAMETLRSRLQQLGYGPEETTS